MGCRGKISKPATRICIGDLDKFITIHDRQITEPVFQGVDFTEEFGKKSSVDVWARIDTATGKAVFGGVNGDVLVTHTIIVRYDPTVTSESWILYNNRRFDILFTENMAEEDRWLKLSCTERGDKQYKAAQA